MIKNTKIKLKSKSKLKIKKKYTNTKIKKKYTNTKIKKKYTNTKIKKNYTNTKIINILTIVKNYYAKQKDIIHVNAYERAIYQIKHWNTEINSGSELANLPGIGKGMIEKIDTILDTGTLPIIKEKGLHMSLDMYLDKIDKIDKIDTLDTINNKTKKNKGNLDTHILGFGEILLNKLKTQYGSRTINDIRKLVSDNKIKLNNTQTLGLKYHEDLITPIPRDEITKLGKIIKDIIETNSFYTSLLAGSYPSGTKTESKDIDILIVINDDVTHNVGIYRNFINQMSILKIPFEIISLGNQKFMGLIKSPISNKWRHLDIRISLIDKLPYAWLYYTGGKIFNKLIRERLKNKGYKLNEYGLYKDDKNVNVNKNYLDKYYIDDYGVLQINEKNMMDYIEYVERQVFEIAGMEYKSVKERY